MTRFVTCVLFIAQVASSYAVRTRELLLFETARLGCVLVDEKLDVHLLLRALVFGGHDDGFVEVLVVEHVPVLLNDAAQPNASLSVALEATHDNLGALGAEFFQLFSAMLLLRLLDVDVHARATVVGIVDGVELPLTFSIFHFEEMTSEWRDAYNFL